MKPYFKRMLWLSGILVLVFAAFIVRINLMIRSQGDAYAERAATRSAKTITLYGMRGTIYDTNMVPLAYDRLSYNITFYRDPSLSSETDRMNYTRSIFKTILLVESNGKKTLGAEDFWLSKDEDNVWRFDGGEYDLSRFCARA